ncbi:MAG TPA: ATP-binding cassette domain-containing protein, partial [Thermomicrobiales bacterium]|nr:ATP-binding cassette domain-containing protein [Thermomicrobiales bacterium]
MTLNVAAGEIHALMGENGAGKSTLIKILAGVVAPDSATIRLDGRAVTIDSPATARRLGLRFIHQELNVVPTLSVAENIVIGSVYPRRAGVLVDWVRLNAMA